MSKRATSDLTSPAALNIESPRSRGLNIQGSDRDGRVSDSGKVSLNAESRSQRSTGSDRIETFTTQWIMENVRKTPGLIDLPYEVDRLSAKITADARLVGIKGLDLAKSVGDIDDFLTVAYHQAPAADMAHQNSQKKSQKPDPIA